MSNNRKNFTVHSTDRRASKGTVKKEVHGNKIMTVSFFVATPKDKLAQHMETFAEQIAAGDFFTGRRTLAQFDTQFGASPAAFAQAKRELSAYDVKVLETRRHNGEVIVRGRYAEFKKLVPNLKLEHVELPDGKTHIARQAGPLVVSTTKEIFTGINGFTRVPVAHPRFKVTPEAAAKLGTDPRFTQLGSTQRSGGLPVITSKIATLASKLASSTSFNPVTLAPLFKPTANHGKGQKIAIISLGGTFLQTDVDAIAKRCGAPTSPKLTLIAVDGVKITADPRGADVENALDYCGAMWGWEAEFRAYCAENSDTGFAHAIAQAIADGCDVITISWGSAEVNWTKSGLDAMGVQFQRAAVAGVSVFAAAGDNDAPDGVEDGKLHTDFPASHPQVMAITGLFVENVGGKLSVSIWNRGDSGTGGGVSNVYGPQKFQAVANPVKSADDGRDGFNVGFLPFDADPASGLETICHGRLSAVGGTSAGGPQAAGYTVAANVTLGYNLGWFAPWAYANMAKIAAPVAKGDNAMSGGVGYKANPNGYSPVGGIGVVSYQDLAASAPQPTKTV